MAENKKKPAKRKEPAKRKRAQVSPKKPPRSKVPPHMDPAKRKQWLERYASRDGRTTTPMVNSSVGVNQRTLDHWLQDEQFVAEMDQIDKIRIKSALSIATTYWPMIVETQAKIASAEQDAPPDLSHMDPETQMVEIMAAQSAYAAREAKKVGMSTRAAEFVGNTLGTLKQIIVQEDPRGFAGLPGDAEGMLEELDRLEAVRRNARRRLEESRGSGGKGTGGGA